MRATLNGRNESLKILKIISVDVAMKLVYNLFTSLGRRRTSKSRKGMKLSEISFSVCAGAKLLQADFFIFCTIKSLKSIKQHNMQRMNTFMDLVIIKNQHFLCFPSISFSPFEIPSEIQKT